jgi:uncharacterized repeat protein (TIGR01451 family)
MYKNKYYVWLLTLIFTLFLAFQTEAQNGNGNGNGNGNNGNGNNGNGNNGNGNPNADELQLMLLPGCYFEKNGEKMYEWRIENKENRDIDFVLEDEDGKKLAEGTAKKKSTTLVQTKYNKNKGDCNQTVLKAKSIKDAKKWVEQKNGRKCGSSNKCKDENSSGGGDSDDDDDGEDDDDDDDGDDDGEEDDDDDGEEDDDDSPIDSLDCGGFRTQTQGGWGAKPSGNNPGAYLHKNFKKVFPNGIIIGCDKTIKLSSAQAVTDFLPQGGSPAVLTKSYVDTKEKISVLAGQVLALTISVKLDSAIDDFGSSEKNLGHLLIKEGTFQGWTVAEVLAEANKILGGCKSEYSPSQINDIIGKINENFVDGKTNKGFLSCPEPQETDLAIEKICPDSTIKVGKEFTYTLIIKNISEIDAIGVTVNDTLPQGVKFVSATKDGVAKDSIISWTLDSLLAGATDTLLVKVKADSAGNWVNRAGITSETVDLDSTNNFSACEVKIEEICPAPPKVGCDSSFAIKVVSFEQAKQKDGGEINSDRANTDNVLGKPQENDNLNFVSLGFGGQIVLELAEPVYNHNKGVKVAQDVARFEGETSAADLIVVETSFGRSDTNCGKDQNENYPERAEFWGRECPEQPWIKLGEGCRNAFIDIAPLIEAGQKYLKFLKIIDISLDSLFSNNDDGYDVDGVIACPAEVIAAITGEGRNPITQGRKEETFRFDRNFINLAPNAAARLSVLEIKAYPNPSSQIVNLELSGTDDNQFEIQIFNTVGVLVKEELIDKKANKITLDIAGYGVGMYIIKISSTHTNYQQSIKIIKQ